jgi:hypothetical protein
MSRTRRTGTLLCAAVVLAIATPRVADAGADYVDINTGSGWTHNSGRPLFAASNFAPGFSQTQTLLVRNDTTDLGNLTLSVDGIVENENGCMHSEAVVDTTCGATEGELGHELQFSVFADPENDGTFEARPRWTGTLYDLATPTSLLTGLPGGGIAGLKIVMTLPFASGNETQTDDVDFSFRLTLAGAGDLGTPGQQGTPGAPGNPGQTSGPGPSAGSGPVTTPQGPGSVEVKGIKVTRHQHSNVLHDITSKLPFTGSETERMVAGALWLLAAGTALSLLAATRRRRTPQN